MADAITLRDHAPAREATFLRFWLWAFIACVIVTIVCVLFVDRPAARFAHDVIGRHPFLEELTRIPEHLVPVWVVLTIVLGLAALIQGSLAHPARVLLLTAVSFFVAQGIKDQLKFDFGRLWPETWVNHNPSFIDTGAYGFFPFHGGAGWGSFPSGHMTAITSTMAVLWVAWPQLRVLWGALVGAVAVGLWGMDYHFVGDMVAGSFLGSAVGCGTARIGGITAPGARLRA